MAPSPPVVGTLYICPTPIGNLSDASPRLAHTLASVSLIACEDTRNTGSLRQLLGIPSNANLRSYHDHNAQVVAKEIASQFLATGLDVALVSDAGTPAICDPGYRLVNAAWEVGARIVSLPGPVAAVTGLVASGLPSDSFLFVGFPPPKEHARRLWLKTHGDNPNHVTIVGYETKHRIKEFVASLNQCFPLATIYLGREISKQFEEHRRGRPGEVLEWLEDRSALLGEFVFAIAFPPHMEVNISLDASVSVRQLAADMRQAGIHKKVIRDLLTQWTGAKKKELFALLEELDNEFS